MAEYRRRLDAARAALRQTEDFVSGAQSPYPGMGDNLPPDGSVDQNFIPLDADAKNQLLAVVRSARQEIDAPYPNKPHGLQLAGLLHQFIEAIGPYLKLSAEMAAKTVGVAGGTLIAAGALGLYNLLVGTYDTFMVWIGSLI